MPNKFENSSFSNSQDRLAGETETIDLSFSNERPRIKTEGNNFVREIKTLEKEIGQKIIDFYVSLANLGQEFKEKSVLTDSLEKVFHDLFELINVVKYRIKQSPRTISEDNIFQSLINSRFSKMIVLLNILTLPIIYQFLKVDTHQQEVKPKKIVSADLDDEEIIEIETGEVGFLEDGEPDEIEFNSSTIETKSVLKPLDEYTPLEFESLNYEDKKRVFVEQLRREKGIFEAEIGAVETNSIRYNHLYEYLYQEKRMKSSLPKHYLDFETQQDLKEYFLSNYRKIKEIIFKFKTISVLRDRSKTFWPKLEDVVFLSISKDKKTKREVRKMIKRSRVKIHRLVGKLLSAETSKRWLRTVETYGDYVLDKRGFSIYFSEILKRDNFDNIMVHLVHLREKFKRQIPLRVLVSILCLEHPSSFSIVNFDDNEDVLVTDVIRKKFKYGPENSGAAGPFQLTKSTAKRKCGLNITEFNDERFVFSQAAECASQVLLENYNKFGRQWSLALVAYSGGESKLRRRLKSIFGLTSRDFSNPDLTEMVFKQKGVNLLSYAHPNIGGLATHGSVMYAFSAEAMVDKLIEEINKQSSK